MSLISCEVEVTWLRFLQRNMSGSDVDLFQLKTLKK